MIIRARVNSAFAVSGNVSMVNSPYIISIEHEPTHNSIGYGGKTKTRADFNSIDAKTLDRSRTSNKTDKQDDSEGSDEISTDLSLDKLSESEKRQVEELKRRDSEVKAHEAAHLAAGGGIVRGGASYSYTSGPDNKRYATGGEVQIDISPANSPESAILKMQQVRELLGAPADPSAQDRSVAQTATKIEAEARRELQQENAGGNQETEIVAADIAAERNDDLASKYIDVIAGSSNRGSLVNAFAQ